MAIDDNPLTVFNRQLENDGLALRVGTGEVITRAARATEVISQVPPLQPLGFIAKGLGLVEKCLELGVPTVEENLKLFAKLTEDAILQLEERLTNLEPSTETAEKLRRRVESKAFLQYLASGVLQTQRTTQTNRLKRMALIIANGVREGDLDLESLDDMMRAAAELTEMDLHLLGDLHAEVTSNPVVDSPDSRLKFWFEYWEIFEQNHRGQSRSSARGSFGRLASFGFLSPEYEPSLLNNPASALYWITEEGIRFYDHLQEIASE